VIPFSLAAFPALLQEMAVPAGGSCAGRPMPGLTVTYAARAGTKETHGRFGDGVFELSSIP